MKKAILKALAYADIFDYPLKEKEIYQFLILNSPLKISNFQKELLDLFKSGTISKERDYFFLKNRQKIVKIRENRKRWSEKKLKIAKKAGRRLKMIPWIKMIGITGSLAMENTNKNDDIDFLIVSSSNRLWLTRLFTVFILELITRRRRPNDIFAKDKICLNIFLDEQHLKLPESNQNLFTAHEVCQMKVLWERGGAYQKLLKENQWVKKYLINGIDKKLLESFDNKEDKKEANVFFDVFEEITYKLQLAYMKKRRTKETVKKHQAFFHPNDCREWILKEYQKRLKNLNL